MPVRSAGYLGMIFHRDTKSRLEEEFEGSSRFSRPRQATSCITILLQFPEQKLRDTFHHDVTGTKLFLSPCRPARLSLPRNPKTVLLVCPVAPLRPPYTGSETGKAWKGGG